MPHSATAEPVRRYERQHPGELIHIDIKKLGRFEHIGHRITGDRQGKSRGIGWEFVHVSIDDASRLAFSQILPDEKKESAVTFIKAAIAYYKSLGVTVARVMTDNGSNRAGLAIRTFLPLSDPESLLLHLHLCNARLFATASRSAMKLSWRLAWPSERSRALMTEPQAVAIFLNRIAGELQRLKTQTTIVSETAPINLSSLLRVLNAAIVKARRQSLLGGQLGRSP